METFRFGMCFVGFDEMAALVDEFGKAVGLFYFVEVLNEKIGIMGNKINPELEAMIEELDEAAVKELQLFVEFLLSKKIPEKETNKKGKPLENMRQILIPLEGLIIDRAEIYDDRG